jgi:hypothetical protein
MIDDLVILFSTFACLFVVFRAIKLDTSRPWFAQLHPAPQPRPGEAQPHHAEAQHAP